MKQIEEKATEAKDALGYAGLEDSLNEQVWETTWGEVIHDIERAYIKGATEQRQIDIDKAYEWLNNVRWTDYVHCDNDVVSVGVHKLAVAFRKAMEE